MKELFLEKFYYLEENAEKFNNLILNEKELDYLEEIFLSDKPLCQLEAYKYMDEYKLNKNNINNEKKRLIKLLLERTNMKLVDDNEMIKLCKRIYDYIDSEKDKNYALRKLDVIDEFARIERNINSEKKWTSGVYLNNEDINKYNIKYSFFPSKGKYNRKSSGIKNNDFIKYFSNQHNYSYDFDPRMTGLIKRDYVINEAHHFDDIEIKNINNMNHLFKEKFHYLYNNTLFLLNVINSNFEVVEEIIYSDKPLNELKSYNYVESLKNNKDFLNEFKTFVEKYENGLQKYKKRGFALYYDCPLLELCQIVYDNLELKYKDEELIKRRNVIDEFARVNRYTNDGKKWTSGVYLNEVDKKNNNIHQSVYSLFVNKGPVNNKCIDSNLFISTFSSKNLQVNDVKDIYFTYHQEIPYDFNLLCNNNKDIKRPHETNPCYLTFRLKKEDIYMDEFGNFLVMCPYCGYINYVNDKDIPEDIKKEIINRSKSKDGEINYHKSLIKKLERENYKKK